MLKPKRKNNVIYADFKNKRRISIFKSINNVKVLRWLLTIYIAMFIASVIILIEVNK